MFVADVKCSQATRQTVPNLWTSSAKASVSEAVVRTWHHTRYHGCVKLSLKRSTVHSTGKNLVFGKHS